MFLSGKKRKNKLQFKNSDIFNFNVSLTDKENYSSIKQKIRTKKLYIILKILIFLNFTVIAVTALLFYLNTENNRNFNRIIFQADRAFSSSDYDQTEIFLNNAVEYSNTKKNTLILLKRFYNLAVHINNYESLNKLSEHFYNIYKNDLRIKKIFLYSLLKNNNVEIFFDIFPFKISDDIFLNDLLLQAYSAYLKDNFDFEINRKINDFFEKCIYFRLLNDNRNIDNYIQAYESERNTSLLNNIILLKMNKGLNREAFKYNNIRNKRDILSSLIFLDNRKYSESSRIISDIADKDSNISLIQADIEMYLSNIANSRNIYSSIYNSDPFYSNIPLINLIWIEYNTQRKINDNYLSDLLQTYNSSNMKNLLYFINLRKVYKNPDQKNILKNNSLLNELFSYNIENQSKYLDLMWGFFNSFNVDDSFNKYFLYILTVTDRYKDLSILLDKEEIRNKPYYDLFKTYYEIKTDHFKSAENYLEEYISKNSCWENFYNIALINIKNKNYSEAVKYLDMIFDKNNPKEKDLSDAYFWKAYSLYRMNNYREASLIIKKSIENNRSNVEAKFLRNHIESKIVES